MTARKPLAAAADPKRKPIARKPVNTVRAAPENAPKKALPKAAGGDATEGLGQRRSRARRDSSEEYVRRRRELLQAAAAVFHQKGLGVTTLGDIAEAAGSDRATLYYYVKNKHELFVEVIRDSMNAVESGAEAILAESLDPAATLRKLIVNMMVQYATHYPYLYIYAVEDLSKLEIDQPWQRELAEHGQHVFDVYRSVVSKGLKDGSFASDLSTGVLVQSIIGLVAWSHRWFQPGVSGDPVKSGEGLANLILGGLNSVPRPAARKPAPRSALPTKTTAAKERPRR
jgi:AcrR family transcriptional regulator